MQSSSFVITNRPRVSIHVATYSRNVNVTQSIRQNLTKLDQKLTKFDKFGKIAGANAGVLGFISQVFPGAGARYHADHAACCYLIDSFHL